jgi:hypothetical protein
MQTFGGFLSFLSQLTVKEDITPMPSLPIEKRSSRNIHHHHFLQAHCLGTQLDLIAMIPLRLTSLILNGEGTNPAVGQRLKLNHIPHTHKAQPE